MVNPTVAGPRRRKRFQTSIRNRVETHNIKGDRTSW
jgi:hypothetical protein